MQTTKVISEKRTALTYKGKRVWRVTRQYRKDNWNHKVSTITDLVTRHENENGSITYKKVYL